MQNTIEQIKALLDKKGKLKLSDLTSEQIEQGEEYISKLDLSEIVFDGKAAKFDEISNSIEMVRYLTSKQKIKDLSEQYISHYTNLNSARKTITGKKLLLGNPDNMNDGLEFDSPNMDCSKLYFASFSIENSENIGMWSMYGQPWEDGIKISIPKEIFMSWSDQIKQVYRVDPNTYDIITTSPLNEAAFKPSTSRVAYVEWNQNRNVTQIKCGARGANKRMKNIDSQILTGLIKDAAWSYEKEIRLRVDLKRKISDKKVAIDIPDKIIKSIVITTGPRFDKNISKIEFVDVADIKKSIFNGKLNYVYCDNCRSERIRGVKGNR